ncbi:MAG: glycosyltransferase family 39 protein [Methanobacterium sp.]|nr:glycosyltransferase family 39 protein [Methanobacterium sp.]
MVVWTGFLLEKQFFLGVFYYDIHVYLNNALMFAGIPVGNLSVVYLSPLMPFLTSLIFRAGLISEHVLFVLDGVIFIIGVLSLYLIFKERFDEVQSFTGILIFLSFPLIFAWAVSGGIDVPGMLFSILTIYTLILGVNKDKRFLYLVFPLFALAFLARYTSAILIFPLLLYLLINKEFFQNLKNIAVGVLAGLAVIVPFLIYVYIKLGNFLPFINIFTSTLLGSGASVNDLGYNPLKLYFLNNILNYISVGPLTGVYGILQSPFRGYPTILSYIIVVILIIGLGIYLYSILKNRLKETDFKNRKTGIKLLIFIILIICGIFSFNYMPYMLCELLFLSILYTGYNILKGRDDKNLKIDFLFLSWIGSFFIFHSIIPLKEDRYFITMLPALAYFILLALSSLIEKFQTRISKKHLKSAIYLAVGIILLSYSTATYIGHVNQEGYGFYLQTACNWLKEYDPHYQEKEIYSNYDPGASWCLKKEVRFGVPRLYVDMESFSNYLRGKNVYYYIDAYSTSPHIPGYHIIYSYETISIYERDL